MNLQRVVTFLDREEVDFLDKVGKDALFSTGLKLSRAKIIAWLIDFIRTFAIDGENIKSEKDLKTKIVIRVIGQSIKEGWSVPGASTSHGIKHGLEAKVNLKADEAD
jgi:hypothetical protein